ncbi:hypothetical protein ONZ45_g692 [Pleurotus djamor]|nr:hypothetical protein ONZ45_g692 [Pleurotus djamor]
MATHNLFKNIVVLGGAYAGGHTAQVLAKGLSPGWRVILVDRNSHANHVYILPRLTVLPGHEHKAFDQPHPHLFLNCQALSLSPGSVKLSKSFPEHGIVDGVLKYEYLVYALGSILPSPLDLWGTDRCGIAADPETEAREALIYHGEKSQGIEWLKSNHGVIEKAASILVVGGGALGVQFASDIAAIHPTKKVTLLHSRDRLLPRFKLEMHVEVVTSLEKLGVEVILGERLDLKSVEEKPHKRNDAGQRVVRTTKGRELAADLLMLCTGQKPNTQILKDMNPKTVSDETHLAHVLRSMQLGLRKPSPDTDTTLDASLDALTLEDTTPYPNIFVGEVAAKNVIRLTEKPDTKPGELEQYAPGPPGIKVSLGMVGGVVGTKDDGVDDLQAASMWPLFGIKVDKDEDMYE